MGLRRLARRARAGESVRALPLVLRLGMHTVISDKRKELAELCRRFDVKKLEVFGSAARGADFDPATSDADFLVEFDPNSNQPPFDRYFDLVEELRETLGRPVDLVEARAIRNPYLRAAIDKSRVLIYAS